MPRPRKAPARKPRRKAPAKKGRSARRPARRQARRGNKQLKVQGKTDGQSMSVFSHSLRSNKPRNVSSMGAPQRYVVTQAGLVVGNVGQQKCQSVGQWFSLADIQNLATQVPSIATSLGNTPTHFTLQGVTAEVTFNNATGSHQLVDIYDIVARKDIPLASATGAIYPVATPYEAWQTGMFDQNVSASGPPTPDAIIGSKPTDSVVFNNYYRIVKRTELVLPQNATHLHKVNINVNRTFNLTELSVMSKYLGGIKDVTHYTMVVVRGGIGFDVAGGVTSTIAPWVRWISLENFRFSFLQASGSTFKYNNMITNPENITVLNLNNPTVGVPVYLF